ncbi:helix-turn-helix domain-containing protein [Sphingobium xenophagum]
MDDSNDPYTHVRALERGLKLLVVLNRVGRAEPKALAKEAGLDRTTSYRLLSTLQTLGYVTKSQSDGKYVLLPSVRELCEGLTETDRLARIAADELFRLSPSVMWPTDFASFEGGWMVIRETTHRFSPYSIHRGMVGRRRPLMDTAMGRAMLVGADRAYQEEMIRIAVRAGAMVGSEEMALERLEWLLDDFACRHYTWAVGGIDRRISAIALPVISKGRVEGSVNLLFFSSSMTVEEAAERYLPDLAATVTVIERRHAGEADNPWILQL